MKNGKIKLFRFEELSESVKNEIVRRDSFVIMDSIMDYKNSEYDASLECFEKETGFAAKNAECGYNGYDFSIENPYDIFGDSGIYAKDCKGKLLFRWCYRFIENNRKNKFCKKMIIDTKSQERSYKSVARYSKILKEPIEGGWCPLTGVYTDCPLVEPIVDFYLNYYRGKFPDNYSLEDLINACFDKFFRGWQEEYEYYGDNTDGCIEEYITVNSEGDLFLEDGTVFKGVYEDVA